MTAEASSTFWTWFTRSQYKDEQYQHGGHSVVNILHVVHQVSIQGWTQSTWRPRRSQHSERGSPGLNTRMNTINMEAEASSTFWTLFTRSQYKDEHNQPGGRGIINILNVVYQVSIQGWSQSTWQPRCRQHSARGLPGLNTRMNTINMAAEVSSTFCMWLTRSQYKDEQYRHSACGSPSWGEMKHLLFCKKRNKISRFFFSILRKKRNSDRMAVRFVLFRLPQNTYFENWKA
jgi:hypothetical protein